MDEQKLLKDMGIEFKKIIKKFQKLKKKYESDLIRLEKLKSMVTKLPKNKDRRLTETDLLNVVGITKKLLSDLNKDLKMAQSSLRKCS